VEALCKKEFTCITAPFQVNIYQSVKETVETQEFGSSLIAVVIAPAV
jgi:hypothetical protein